MFTQALPLLWLLGCGPSYAIPDRMLETPLDPVPVARGRTTPVTLRWLDVEGNTAPTLRFGTPNPPGLTLTFVQQEVDADVRIDVAVTNDAPLSSYEIWIDHVVPGGLTMSMLALEVVE